MIMIANKKYPNGKYLFLFFVCFFVIVYYSVELVDIFLSAKANQTLEGTIINRYHLKGSDALTFTYQVNGVTKKQTNRVFVAMSHFDEGLRVHIIQGKLKAYIRELLPSLIANKVLIILFFILGGVGTIFGLKSNKTHIGK
jgi:hypothetical protein